MNFSRVLQILVPDDSVLPIAWTLVLQRMSQFWYSDETATRLAEEVVREAGEGGRWGHNICAILAINNSIYDLWCINK